jgi:thiopurine S-methyltransferase
MQDSDYWKNRWKTRNIGWHQSEVEPLLVEYFPKSRQGRVLVPLCGKSLDMVWLTRQGWEVVGADLSPIACAEFFQENFPEEAVRPEKQGDFLVYRGSKVTLYCGDFFRLTASELAGVSAVYDRAALIALPPELRSKYVAQLQTLLTKEAPVELLLITIEYPGLPLDGPPFSVSVDEVQHLYGSGFKTESIPQLAEPSVPVRTPQSGEVRATQHVFRMRKV